MSGAYIEVIDRRAGIHLDERLEHIFGPADLIQPVVDEGDTHGYAFDAYRSPGRQWPAANRTGSNVIR